jgi:hypothetical protein
MIGALRLLAESYGVQEINAKGFALYADFRPKVDGWGGRGDVRCETILALRKKGVGNEKSREVQDVDRVVKFEKVDNKDSTVKETEEPESKKSRGMTLEEYEAALDLDTSFDDIDLDLDLL